MKCPRCGLINPESALYCDCGYDFSGKEITRRRLPFEFTGNGQEYFRIWIVNVLLSMMTFGIYSAWAKVRTKNYFYRNTKVAGSVFEYHARPIQILKGRLFLFGAIIILGIISGIVERNISTSITVLALPWLIVKSRVFNARKSSWRNIRFGFNEDSVGNSYMTFLCLPMLIPLTIGFILPYNMYRTWGFHIQNSRFGTKSFRFCPEVKEYYRAFTLTGLTAFLVFFLFTFLRDTGSFATLPDYYKVTLALSVYGFFIGLKCFITMARNISLNGMLLGTHTFTSTVKVWPMLWISISNTIAIVCSVGLLIPWAKVRTTRYLTDHLVLNAADDLESFIQAEHRKESALGEAAVDLMDFDIGGI